MTPPPADPAKKLAALLKSLRASHGEPQDEPWLPASLAAHDPLVGQFIFSFLLWESSPSRAAASFERLTASMIDTNELRVSLPDEIAAAAGDESPLALERATRLRSSLNDLYRRHHAVTLEPLAGMGKRDARQSLYSLDGVPPFVAARVTLLCLGGHAFPLDRRLHRVLESECALPAGLGVDEAIGWLERTFRTGEALPAYITLEAWMDARPQGSPPGGEADLRPAGGGGDPQEAARTPRRGKSEGRKARSSTSSKRADA